MLLGGDEFGRTQGGNNNAWCQDTEISWFDWDVDEATQELLEFTRRLIALRRAHAVFRRRQFLFGSEVEGSGLPDAWWFRTDGRRMTKRDWDELRRSSACSSTARRSPRRTRAASRCSTSRSCCCSTALTTTSTFTLPPGRFGRRWTLRAAHRRHGRDGPGASRSAPASTISLPARH